MRIRIEGNQGADSFEITEATRGSEDVPIVVEHCGAETFRGSIPLMLLTAVLSDLLGQSPTEIAALLPFEPAVNRGLANAITRTKKRVHGAAEDWSDMARTSE